MKVINRIAEIRRQRGVTLHELADKTGQHFTTVARHQSGSITRIPREKLVRYAEIFDCSMMDLFIDPKTLPGGGVGTDTK